MIVQTQLITARGYPSETHEVRTADGYLLTIHRIPRPATGSGNATLHGVPVLVGHGMGSSNEQWLLREKDNLTDYGFDVWLANYRGSFYAQRHETLSVASQKFWDFR
ncbi:hypothetical protein FOCC_FOCC015428 [Frankliniella occidentalis]|nr:hypothetical protein FOCC_FOCC015428 [Frankliniella occidentalis]